MATHGLSCNHWRLSWRERIDEALREGARPLIVACGIVTVVLGLVAVAS